MCRRSQIFQGFVPCFTHADNDGFPDYVILLGYLIEFKIDIVLCQCGYLTYGYLFFQYGLNLFSGSGKNLADSLYLVGIPEPSTLILFTMATLALLAYASRTRRTR